MDSGIFPFFIKYLDKVDRCGQVCFPDVPELGITLRKHRGLWISTKLCANYPQLLISAFLTLETDHRISL